MVRLFLSLGSNLGDRGENLKKALVELENWGIKILRSSSLYETEPVGFKNQPWFYNLVALAETKLKVEDVWKALQMIEFALGREKTFKNGPRKIDLDLLFYGDLVLERDGFAVPHLRLQQRKFVLLPLTEIAPDFVHPVLKKTARELLKECSDESKVQLL